jgi:hypothetical protein
MIVSLQGRQQNGIEALCLDRKRVRLQNSPVLVSSFVAVETWANKAVATIAAFSESRRRRGHVGGSLYDLGCVKTSSGGIFQELFSLAFTNALRG